MAAVFTAERSSASGALSVVLKVNVTDYNDGLLPLDHATLITGASDAELASWPIYRDFLNVDFASADSPNDAANQRFADLGGTVSGIGNMYLKGQWMNAQETDGKNYPRIQFEELDTDGYATIRIALASSIAS